MLAGVMPVVFPITKVYIALSWLTCRDWAGVKMGGDNVTRFDSFLQQPHRLGVLRVELVNFGVSLAQTFVIIGFVAFLGVR